MRNPLVKGRMYKVADGGQIKGFRVNKSGTVDVLVVPGAKKRNPKQKRPKKKPNGKRKNASIRKLKKELKRAGHPLSVRRQVVRTTKGYARSRRLVKKYGHV